MVRAALSCALLVALSSLLTSAAAAQAGPDLADAGVGEGAGEDEHEHEDVHPHDYEDVDDHADGDGDGDGGGGGDEESVEQPVIEVFDEAVLEEPSYGARATVDQTKAPKAAALSDRQARILPGGLGDPFRMSETMPGAAPMVSGLPYFYVRGSPPSGNAYYYDGIPLPQLYHLGLGPAVLHPMLLGPIAFHAGASPARYGQRVGAVIDAAGPTLQHRTYGELDVRLLDANAVVVTPIGEGTLATAGRFGYPGLLMPALGIKLSFSYWDYQLRALYPLSSRDSVEVIALGSHDQLDNAEAVGASVGYEEEGQDLELDFHRIEARLIRRLSGFELGAALRAGYDNSHIGRDVAASAHSVTPRMWLKKRLSGGHVVEAGASIKGSAGEARELPRADTFDSGAATAVSRMTAGVYADFDLRLADWSLLSLGGRSDVWIIAGHAEPAFDPRARFTVYPADGLDVHIGAGLVHQPVVFVFPLPALTDVAVDRGLQRALQTELGAGIELGGDTRFETNLFWHRYEDLLLPEVYLRALGDDAQRADSVAYGVEAFLLRKISQRVSGWISYTLAFAKTTDPLTNTSFRPEFDIRHVANIVTHVRVVGGLSAGLRLQARSGKPVNQFTDQGIPASHDLQLPFFVKADARVGYRWALDWGAMDLYAEMLNVTLAQEAVDAECFFSTCRAVLAEPIFFPNVGLLTQF